MRVDEALETLGVSATATAEAMASAFRRRLLRWHPDKADADAQEAKQQTQRLLEARARLVAAGFFSTQTIHSSASSSASHSRRDNNAQEDQWRAKCAQKRARTAEARERLWQAKRDAAQAARAARP